MSANDCFWSKNFGYLFFHHSSINIVIFPKKKLFYKQKKTDVYECKKTKEFNDRNQKKFWLKKFLPYFFLDCCNVCFKIFVEKKFTMTQIQR